MDTSIPLPLLGVESAHCAMRVEQALRTVPAITGIDVRRADQVAVITSASPGPAVREAVAAIRRAGYDVAVEQHRSGTQGISCAGCAGSATAALTALPGVLDVALDVAGATATITTIKGALSTDDLARALRPLGYGLLPLAA
ncbi:MAG: cation transporter [Bacteroidetes bacterium]|nr:cation transporter [Bacteroidota bacterium]